MCPKLDPYKRIIDQWLMDDKKAPRKQRHTAKRVYNRLRNEVEGFDCSYRLVADYVRSKKQELNLDKKDTGKAPLIHYPGEAQCDFGSATFGYSVAAEPPVRCGESHLSRLTEPPLLTSYFACAGSIP